MHTPANTVFYKKLADEIMKDNTITKLQAEQIFIFFKNCNLFRWQDKNNDCEDRANAICILLDHWKIPNYKGWIFGGNFLRKNSGSLKNNWKYHVAALLPVKENDDLICYIIDPATSNELITIDEWASQITGDPVTYYLIKSGHFYIFSSKRIERDNWYKRNKRNYRWTMQGLSGINGLSSTGKAQLSFKIPNVNATAEKFAKLKTEDIFVN